MLPFIEQGSIYDGLNFSVGVFEGANKTFINTLGPIQTVLCPSDERRKVRDANGTAANGMARIPGTSYFGSIGAFDWDGENSNRSNGIFVMDPARTVSFASVKDGTTNTIAFGEVYGVLNEDGSFLGCQDGTATKVAPTSNTFNGEHWYRRHGERVLNSRNSAAVSGGFSSAHDGGAQFCMADGSVRFISENIDYILSSNASEAANDRGMRWATGEVDGTIYLNKTTLATRLGTYQRLFSRHDGLVVGEF